MKNIRVSPQKTRFLVMLLIICGTLMFISGAHQLHLEDKQWRDFLEAKGLSPEKAAIRNTIHDAPRGMKPIIRWKNHWKFQRCPPGMKRDNVGMCRPVWGYSA
jgi:hypothetical protein